MPTKILAIQPQLDVNLITFNNASWVDSFPFVVAASASGYPSTTNIGNGAITVIAVAPQAIFGSYTVRISAPSNGTVAAQVSAYSPDNTLIAIGSVGSSLSAGGVIFTISAGSIPFAVGDSFSIGVLPGPLDITGIAFSLMLRRSAGDAAIDLSASTADGSIANGGTAGQVGMRVQTTAMQGLPAGTYAYDLIASADGYDVLAYQGSVAHTQGVTAPAS